MSAPISLRGDALTHLLLHFVLINTTNTARDESTGRVWKIHAMRVTFGHDVVEEWLADRQTRRTTYPDRHLRIALSAGAQ